jgi:acyl-CoA thioesterase-1
MLPTLCLVLVIPAVASCTAERREELSADAAAAPVASEGTAAAPAAAPSAPRIVFLGDSLTAGFGLAEDQAFPALVGEMLAKEGKDFEIVNAGVSGDTTAGGLARLDWLLTRKPRVVVVGLGGNDALRGLPLDETEKNLREIVTRCQGSGARVLLLGMKMLPNYGPDYVRRFEAIYPRLAEDLDVELVPFLLDRVGGVPGLNQDDGIHPTALGQRLVAENVLPYLRRVV